MRGWGGHGGGFCKSREKPFLSLDHISDWITYKRNILQVLLCRSMISLCSFPPPVEVLKLCIHISLEPPCWSHICLFRFPVQRIFFISSCHSVGQLPSNHSPFDTLIESHVGMGSNCDDDFSGINEKSECPDQSVIPLIPALHLLLALITRLKHIASAPSADCKSRNAKVIVVQDECHRTKSRIVYLSSVLDSRPPRGAQSQSSDTEPQSEQNDGILWRKHAC